MKKSFVASVGLLLCITLTQTAANAQAFKRGTLLVSISEGHTAARVTTFQPGMASGSDDVIRNAEVCGDRDPLTIEYGLSKHWGIGINLGGDILRANPEALYGFQLPSGKINMLSSEFTVDGHYHFFVTKRTDLSAFLSMGIATVIFSGSEGDRSYRYEAGGGIVRGGVQARYYVFRRFGIHGMFSGYNAACSAKDITTNTVGGNSTTLIRGRALEFGICYRFF